MSKVTGNPPIIVGAGPVGLAAALFLARRGVAVRIIDQAAEPSAHSKALAVNPRTLTLLEETGVTEKMLALGGRIVGAQFHADDRIAAALDFASLEHKYPFMVALSQGTSERLLAEAAAALGVHVERQVRLVDCSADGHVRVELEHAGEGRTESAECPWLLAADGAHSAVRHALKLNFEGRGFKRPWYLADVRLETSLAEDRAHITFLNDGFLFLLRVVTGDEGDDDRPPMWRVLGNTPDFLDRLGQSRVAGEPTWKSDFHVAHRMIERMQVGPVSFAGDAAHIHSPVGARGMNLGIEDAFVFAELVHRGTPERYDAARRIIDHGVVKRIERISRIARGESAAARFARSHLMPHATHFAAIRRTMIETVTGLDHAVSLP